MGRRERRDNIRYAWLCAQQWYKTPVSSLVVLQKIRVVKDWTSMIIDTNNALRCMYSDMTARGI
jgi:hypothetical protein